MTAYDSTVVDVGTRFVLPDSAIPESVEAHPLAATCVDVPHSGPTLIGDRVLYTWEERETDEPTKEQLRAYEVARWTLNPKTLPEPEIDGLTLVSLDTRTGASRSYVDITQLGFWPVDFNRRSSPSVYWRIYSHGEAVDLEYARTCLLQDSEGP